MSDAIDAGPIVYQAMFDIAPEDTGLSVAMRCVRLGIPLIAKVVEAAGGRAAIPRIEQRLDERTYFPPGPPLDGRVDGPLGSPDRRFRAGRGLPSVRVSLGPSPDIHGTQEVEITKASSTGEPTNGRRPGTVGDIRGAARSLLQLTSGFLSSVRGLRGPRARQARFSALECSSGPSSSLGTPLSLVRGRRHSASHGFSDMPTVEGRRTGEYLRQVEAVARWSEDAGCTGVLVFTDNGLLDPWVVSHAILRETSTLCPLVALQPAYMHPYAAAKMVTLFAYLYGRRIFLNMVAGGFRNDLLALSDDTPHDERYDRLVEYTEVVMALLSSEKPITFEGRYYRVKNSEAHASDASRTLLPGLMVSAPRQPGSRRRGKSARLQSSTLALRRTNRKRPTGAASLECVSESSRGRGPTRPGAWPVSGFQRIERAGSRTSSRSRSPTRAGIINSPCGDRKRAETGTRTGSDPSRTTRPSVRIS